jgi:hypothetical protein
MEMIHATPFSTLTDDEFLRHLTNKGEPSAEDVEAALRLEMLLSNYNSLLEQIHSTALTGMRTGREAGECLARISELTAPAPR